MNRPRLSAHEMCSLCMPVAALAFAVLVAGLTPVAGATAPQGAGSELTVPLASICTEVKDREAVGAGSQFPSSVGRLYCLTKIAGATDKTRVTHLWFHEDQQVHKVDLPVDGPAWRTWSYKTIPPGWTGKWRVDVQDANGVVIYSIPFTVSDQAAAPPSGTPAAKTDQGESH